jgi:pyruvate/2-oxoglutarate dehydrogenase complex dihydrolipoamide acyltransferase (E2) component
MAYEVIDRRGRVITLRDDEPFPDGCTLRVPLQFMDSMQRSVAAASGDLSEAEAAAMRAGEAWEAYRKRLGTPKARRMPLQAAPSWQQASPAKMQSQQDGAPRDYAVTDAMVQRCVDARAEYVDRISRGMNRHRIPITAESADAVVEAMDSDPNFHPGRYAYDQMKQRISNAWRGGRE